MRALAVAALLSIGLATTSAAANGRFPAAGQLIVDSTDPLRIVVRTTFGLLQSTDGGKTWRWICEARVGFTGTFDPAISLNGGVLLAGLPDGLSRTTDRGCTWTRAGYPLDREVIVDLAGSLFAVSAAVDPSLIGFRALVARSNDQGATWKLTPSLLPEDLQPTTIEVAPSRPQRIYVSGVGPFKRFATVARSDDGGATFLESTFDMGTSIAPYLAAVDPRDPDRVWLRFDGGDEKHTLLLSRDGGIRFEEVRTLGKLLGFALSPDGTKVAIGGPSDGLWIAGTDDLAFVRVSGVRVRCLMWTTDGLWACSDDTVDGFAIGFSRDGGKTFEPRLHLADVQPLACASPQCDSAWRDLSGLLGRPDAGPVADANTPDASIDAVIDATVMGEPSPSGCGCSTKGSRVATLPLLALILLYRITRRA